ADAARQLRPRAHTARPGDHHGYRAEAGRRRRAAHRAARRRSCPVLRRGRVGPYGRVPRALRGQATDDQGRMSMSNESSTAEATSAFVNLNGLRFHYLEWGNHAAPPLLLLHGFTGHARQWEYVAGELRADFRVLALDQRGHGDSDRAEVYG